MAIKYHYCNMETFQTIISKKTLRLSDVRKSNDNLEQKMIYEQYESIKDLAVSWYEMSKNEKIFIHWMSIYDKIKKASNEMICLACCFSNGSDKLSQWERYADGGKGIAIGFDEEELKQHMGNLNEKFSKTNYSNLIQFIAQDITYSKRDLWISPGDAAILTTNPLKLAIDTAFTKHAGFNEEDEFRIALIYHKDDKSIANLLEEEDKMIVNKCIDSDCIKNNGKQYIDIRFEPSWIKEIWVGPLVDKRIYELEIIEGFCEKHGYDFYENGAWEEDDFEEEDGKCKLLCSSIPYIPKRK